MRHAEITMKSGAAIAFSCTVLTTRSSKTSGELTGISWEGAIDAPMYLNLSEVAAVVVRADQS